MVDVSEDRGDIIFRFHTNDTTTLDVLFLPILRKKDMGTLTGNNDFSALSFNGPYVFSEKDIKTGAIVLKKNPAYRSIKDRYFLDQVRFGFGQTKKEVKKSIDPDIWLGDVEEPDSEFLKQAYSRPVLYGIYLNSDRIQKPLRNALFYDVFNTIEFDKSNFIPKENIFLGDIQNSPRTSGNPLFFQTAFSLGYSFGGTAPAPTVVPPAVPEYTSLKYVNQPGNMSPLFFSKELLEIQGTPPTGTTKVVVNDYALQGFRAGSKLFSYKAHKDYKNLVDGENIYKIQFFAGSKLLKEEKVTVFYNTNAAALDVLKAEWTKKNTPVVEVKPVNLPVDTDPKKLYDKNQKLLEYTILVQSEVPVFREIAEKIQTKLENLSVGVQVKYLPLSDITRMAAESNSAYDIVLAGVNLGVFHYNILPFFHSGQIKNGFNISRIRSITLDSLTEKLIERLYYNAPDKLRTLETDIQKILESESLVFPLGTPEESWYIKSYVLGVSPPSFFSGKEMMSDIIAKSYFKEGYRRSSEPKTVS